MLPVFWRPSAEADLLKIVDYIAQFNPGAAVALRTRIESAVVPLSEHPYLYRVGRILGTRELLAHPNYLVIYRVLDDRVDVSNIVHVARDFP
jgi:toxin ParE1/3/4